MNDLEIRCNDCDWMGYTTDLASKTAALEDKDFIHCPDCQSTDIEDIEQEEE